MRRRWGNMNVIDTKRLEPATSVAPETMRAAVVTGAGTIRIERVPVPEPGEGEIRVRLEGCGVCASNLGPWAGPDWMEFPTRPGDLGHEGWGVVDAVGPGVENLAVGDRVAPLFYNSYAEYDVGPADMAVRLPDGSAGKPFPGEPLGCAMNIWRRSQIEPGQIVAVVGAGFLGNLLIQLASKAGAKVVAISRRGYALDAARKSGAAEVSEFGEPGETLRRIEQVSGEKLCDRVIEATGTQAGLDLASELTGVRGRLIIAGYHQDARTVNMQQWNWRGIDVINAHERDPATYVQGMKEAVESVGSGRLEPAPLYTHRFPLERLAEALDMTRDRPEGFMKALVLL